MTQTAPTTVFRHDALLRRIATNVAGYDGSRPGGALLGPRLFLIAAQERLSDERLVRLGAAVEMIRRATLVHRDPRRESPWEGYGETPFPQTLLGDLLLSESFRLLAADGDPRAVQLLSRAMASVAAGELERHTCDEYEANNALERMVAYYEGTAATGALLGGMDARGEERFREWARTIGFTHERSLSGETGTLSDLERLRETAPDGAGALTDGILENLGAPDMLRP